MKALDKEQVLHVAKLARLKITDEEVSRYGVQLAEILTEIDKIQKVELKTKTLLIAPTTNHDQYHDDQVGIMLKREDVLKNAPRTLENYIVVPKVINND